MLFQTIGHILRGDPFYYGEPQACWHVKKPIHKNPFSEIPNGWVRQTETSLLETADQLQLWSRKKWRLCVTLAGSLTLAWTMSNDLPSLTSLTESSTVSASLCLCLHSAPHPQHKLHHRGRTSPSDKRQLVWIKQKFFQKQKTNKWTKNPTES